ncbi:MAG: hypothetical protein JWM99_1716, partial [Verrucomicrobiales bacterium]|nr:hypothetical protein [Verrucomicrobiales bacterium]
MKIRTFLHLVATANVLASVFASAAPSPVADTTQLPRAMHTEMKDRPKVTVGVHSGDMMGADNRALQAAVDYVASLGGGTVVIGPGEYLMRDSLHLRAQVTVRGTPGQTVLR